MKQTRKVDHLLHFQIEKFYEWPEHAIGVQKYHILPGRLQTLGVRLVF